MSHPIESYTEGWQKVLREWLEYAYNRGREDVCQNPIRTPQTPISADEMRAALVAAWDALDERIRARNIQVNFHDLATDLAPLIKLPCAAPYSAPSWEEGFEAGFKAGFSSGRSDSVITPNP
jgi:hypothetical protein